MTDVEIIEIVQAHIAGKPIEICSKGQGKDQKWYDVVNPKWDFQNCDYRVKQESHKPREWRLLIDRKSNGVYGMATESNQTHPSSEIVRVIEVLE